MTSLIERLTATIASYTRLFQRNDAILAREQKAEIHGPNWTRVPPFCDTHPNEPKFQVLFETPNHKKGEWICHSCEDAKRFAQKEETPTLLSASPDYRVGEIFLAPLQAEHAFQKETVRQMAFEKFPTLPRYSQKNVPTAPLAARDIVYQNTGEEVTERRPAIKLSKATKLIPAISAEVTLLELMRGPAYERGTGEQERLPEANWMV